MAEQAVTKTAKKEPEVELVSMEDGRKVEFVGKRKMNKESGQLESGALSIRIDFRNGKTRTYPLNPALINTFALHGAEQKYGDEAAGLEELDDAVEAIDALHERLTKGEWTQAREASGFAGASIVIRAMCEQTGKTAEAIKAFVEAKLAASEAEAQASGGEKKALTRQALYTALRNSEKLKPIVARLEAERAAKQKGASKVDADAILGELA